MKMLLKNELHRAFSSRGFLLAMLVSGGTAVLQIIFSVLPTYEELDLYLAIGDMVYPSWLYEGWLGGHRVGAWSHFYFLILPLLAALPFSSSLFEDSSGGIMYNICIRIERRKYLTAKYIAVFLSGGAVVTAPLLLNFIAAAMFLPAMKPDAAFGGYGVTEYTSTFGWLFYHLPTVYVLLFLIIIFIFGGLFAAIGLAVAHHLGHRYLVLIAPFMLYMFLSALFGLVDMSDWQPMWFLFPAFGGDVLIPMVVQSVLLLFWTITCGIYTRAKKDIF